MKTDFPEIFEEPYARIVKLDEEWMKSKDGKDRWRKFIESYKDSIKDYNFGSLIRTDALDEYSEKNTIFSESSRALKSNILMILGRCSDADTILRVRDRAQPTGPER